MMMMMMMMMMLMLVMTISDDVDVDADDVSDVVDADVGEEVMKILVTMIS